MTMTDEQAHALVAAAFSGRPLAMAPGLFEAALARVHGPQLAATLAPPRPKTPRAKTPRATDEEPAPVRPLTEAQKRIAARAVREAAQAAEDAEYRRLWPS